MAEAGAAVVVAGAAGAVLVLTGHDRVSTSTGPAALLAVAGFPPGQALRWGLGYGIGAGGVLLSGLLLGRALLPARAASARVRKRRRRATPRGRRVAGTGGRAV